MLKGAKLNEHKIKQGQSIKIHLSNTFLDCPLLSCELVVFMQSYHADQ